MLSSQYSVSSDTFRVHFPAEFVSSGVVPMPPDPAPPDDSVFRLLTEARAGSVPALGTLFERYRAYLLLIANAELAEEVRAKLGPSDVVQQTWLKVQQGFGQFQGETADIWKAWLSEVLRNTLANCEREFSTAKRDVGREVPLHGGDSGVAAGQELSATGSSPSSIVVRQERDQVLLAAVQSLPEHYCEVVRLHSLKGVPFDEIARRQGKSESAVRKLWGRALAMLAEVLGEQRP
jgi:RNA polymerase sigma-70 factor (ECF subfamily)